MLNIDLTTGKHAFEQGAELVLSSSGSYGPESFLALKEVDAAVTYFLETGRLQR
jgi:hypothetical protein